MPTNIVLIDYIFGRRLMIDLKSLRKYKNYVRLLQKSYIWIIFKFLSHKNYVFFVTILLRKMCIIL